MIATAPAFVRPAAGRPLTRYAQTTDALRQRELAWWAQFGESEERYFWGITDSWQPLARLRYIDRMAAVFAGWREMNDYMRENKIDEVHPQLAGAAPAAKSSEEADGERAEKPPAKGREAKRATRALAHES